MIGLSLPLRLRLRTLETGNAWRLCIYFLTVKLNAATILSMTTKMHDKIAVQANDSIGIGNLVVD